MEVNLPPDVETKLARLANQRGSDAQALARAAIESFVDYDDWFIREVEKGLAQIDQGKVLTHEDVGTRLENIWRKSSRVLECSFAGRKRLQRSRTHCRLLVE